MRSQKPAENTTTLDDHQKDQSPKKLLDNHNQNELSSSDISININSDDDTINNVDQYMLISKMVKEKSLDSLSKLGGLKEVAAILKSDLKSGVSGEEADLARRRSVYGENAYEINNAKSFLSSFVEAIKDTTVIILLVCAVLSLALGLIKQHETKEDWYDGGSIIIAVFLVVMVSAFNNFKQSQQHEKLLHQKNDTKVRVLRSWRLDQVSISDIVVGDIVFLETGDQIPADGLFLIGSSLMVDESSMTGVIDLVEVNNNRNPFLLSGTKVTNGFGSMIVTSVGMKTAWGEKMSSIISRVLYEQTPLQKRLEKLTAYIRNIGFAVALLVLTIDCFTRNTKCGDEVDGALNSVVSIIGAAATIVVAAIPEGLPLAVTLTLAHSMKHMKEDKATVLKLHACETMGSITTICTDKTGSLTSNQMKVAEFWIGKEVIEDDSSMGIEPKLSELLHEGIVLNTSAVIYMPRSSPNPEISGTPTEKAILSWFKSDFPADIDKIKQSCEVIHVEAFNSNKRRSGVLIRKTNEMKTHTHWKGAAEMIVKSCSSYYSRDGSLKELDEEEKIHMHSIIKNMAKKSLRCIAFAFKEVGEDNQRVSTKLEETGLSLLGIVGLKDPCRPGVRIAVDTCNNAGVSVKMITGDSIYTATAVARECGILNLDKDELNKAVVEGVQFRNFSPEERTTKIDEIRVMARASSFDKVLMVKCLKEKGHVVAVIGDSTNDASALNEADIGLSKGIEGTEVAKESSQVVILDDNFASIVTSLRLGRRLYYSIQKLIQLQLIVNISAITINFIVAVSSGDVSLTAVKLLWLNLIMYTLEIVALATEKQPHTNDIDLMTKPPVGKSEPLITGTMWWNVIAEAFYQVAISLTMEFTGKSIFKVDKKVKDTLIFNTFVIRQVFNEFNARKLESKSIFKVIYEKKLFSAIIGITVVLQALMLEILNNFGSTERLTWGQWAVCILMSGSLS